MLVVKCMRKQSSSLNNMNFLSVLIIVFLCYSFCSCSKADTDKNLIIKHDAIVPLEVENRLNEDEFFKDYKLTNLEWNFRDGNTKITPDSAYSLVYDYKKKNLLLENKDQLDLFLKSYTIESSLSDFQTISKIVFNDLSYEDSKLVDDLIIRMFSVNCLMSEFLFINKNFGMSLRYLESSIRLNNLLKKSSISTNQARACTLYSVFLLDSLSNLRFQSLELSDETKLECLTVPINVVYSQILINKIVDDYYYNKILIDEEHILFGSESHVSLFNYNYKLIDNVLLQKDGKFISTFSKSEYEKLSNLVVSEENLSRKKNDLLFYEYVKEISDKFDKFLKTEVTGN